MKVQQTKALRRRKNPNTTRKYLVLQGEHIVRTSVVTVTEFAPPLWWLSIIEPTQPPQCFTVFSAVSLGAVSQKLPDVYNLRNCVMRNA